VEQVLEQLQVQIRWVEVKTTVSEVDIIHLKDLEELKFINLIPLSLMVLVVQEPLQAHIIHLHFLHQEAMPMLRHTILQITTI